MFKNYFKTAWRNVTKYKTFSAINIGGLSVGIACALLILVHVKKELSYEMGFANRNLIYRVTQESIGENTRHWAATSPIIGRELKDEFPGIQSVVRFYRPMPYQLLSSQMNEAEPKQFEEKGGLFADPGVVNMFGLEFSKGDPATALIGPDAVVLTEDFAKKYFGNTDPVGRILNDDLRKLPLTVKGVLKDFSSPSHLKFDYLISMPTIKKFVDDRSMENRGWQGFYTYVQLHDSSSLKNIETGMTEFTVRFNEKNGDKRNEILRSERTHLQPISTIHLHSKLEKELYPNSDITFVYIFSIAAFFILLIAAVNFINISTTLAINRMKEIGMRKVIGATRGELIRQFLGESFFVTLLSASFALILFRMSIPFYEQITNSRLSILSVFTFSNILIFVSLIVLLSVLSGLYPAWFVTRFDPIESIKGKSNPGGSVHLVRKGLTVFQFVVSVFLIFGTIVIYRQMKLFHEMNLGFDKEQVIAVTMYEDMWRNFGSLVHDMDANPSISAHSTVSNLPGDRFGFYSFRPLGANDNKDFPESSRVLWSDANIVKTLKLSLTAGTDFKEQFPEIKNHEFILNEAAVVAYKFKEPVGKSVILEGDTGTVVGVVKNFNFRSLHEKVEPLVIEYNPYKTGNLLVKIPAGQLPAALKFLEAKITALAASKRFSYSFLDEYLDRLYDTENRMGQVFKAFATLAIFISCLGLFGLSAYTARSRTREIGIRKVLGASEFSLVSLLTKDFIGLVIVAIGIALPLAWFVMNRWLNDFAYHVTIGPWVLLVSAILALIIAIATVSVQAIRSAILNPIKTLKTE